MLEGHIQYEPPTTNVNTTTNLRVTVSGTSRHLASSTNRSYSGRFRNNVSLAILPRPRSAHASLHRWWHHGLRSFRPAGFGSGRAASGLDGDRGGPQASEGRDAESARRGQVRQVRGWMRKQRTRNFQRRVGAWSLPKAIIALREGSAYECCSTTIKTPGNWILRTRTRRQQRASNSRAVESFETLMRRDTELILGHVESETWSCPARKQVATDSLNQSDGAGFSHDRAICCVILFYGADDQRTHPHLFI